MPIPTPHQNESKDEFIARCMGVVGNEFDQNQALAVCFSAWDEGKDMNDSLLKSINSRSDKRTEYWNGISTADRYVKTVEDALGLDGCYKYLSNKSSSFNDVMEKAKKTLVYANDEMVVDEKSEELKTESVEFPKNTLISFKHILTTANKDRDGDILRTDGAIPDPKMLLLWQHVHTLPIGKVLSVVEHTKNRLSMISCIVDMNKLCHDAAVMIDNDMGRFSHGFRALEFEELKSDGEEWPGFDIKKFEIMEASLVSVPANPDAEVQEVIVDLVEGGKLTSSLMKSYGKHLRNILPVKTSITYKQTNGESQTEIVTENAADFEKVFNVVGETNANGSEVGEKEGQKNGTVTSEETQTNSNEETKETSHQKVDWSQFEGKSLSMIEFYDDFIIIEFDKNERVCVKTLQNETFGDEDVLFTSKAESEIIDVPPAPTIEDQFKSVLSWSEEHQERLVKVISIFREQQKDRELLNQYKSLVGNGRRDGHGGSGESQK